jgi:hypothetical protein
MEKEKMAEAEHKASNPVHRDPDGKWYFYDETWADRLGPFDSEEEANAACAKYAHEILGD